MMKLDIDYLVAYNANKSTTWKGSWYNFEASCMSSWLMMQVFWFLKENQYHDKTPVLTKRRYYNSKLSGDILRNFFCCGFMPVLTLKKKVHLKKGPWILFEILLSNLHRGRTRQRTNNGEETEGGEVMGKEKVNYLSKKSSISHYYHIGNAISIDMQTAS